MAVLYRTPGKDLEKEKLMKRIESLEKEVSELRKYKQMYERDEWKWKAISDFENAISELEEVFQKYPFSPSREEEFSETWNEHYVPIGLKVRKTLLNLKSYFPDIEKIEFYYQIDCDSKALLHIAQPTLRDNMVWYGIKSCQWVIESSLYLISTLRQKIIEP